MIQLQTLIDGKFKAVEVNSFVFSGGETQVKVDLDFLASCKDTVDVIVHNACDPMRALLTFDAIRRARPRLAINLVLPYLPYARQDRVCADGESLALAVFVRVIDSVDWNEIRLFDVHSDVAIALFQNSPVIHFKTEYFFPALFDLEEYATLVAPDAGAAKKVQSIAKICDKEFVQAGKIRDVNTGEITGTEVYGDVENKRVLIVDDICDGGRTFIELTRVLLGKGAKSVDLYVTHGIFSRGLVPLWAAGIRRVLTTNTFRPRIDSGFGQGHTNRAVDAMLVVRNVVNVAEND
jgi:ribose-phosphate pyrophosphokinase